MIKFLYLTIAILIIVDCVFFGISNIKEDFDFSYWKFPKFSFSVGKIIIFISIYALISGIMIGFFIYG